jgi:hypothetical protein
MPNNKVIQGGLSSDYWWMKDTLQGFEDHINEEPNKTSRPQHTGSRTAFDYWFTDHFLKSMVTKDIYSNSTANNNTSILSTSKASSNKVISSGNSSTGKEQTTGNNTSKEDEDESIGSDSYTEAIKNS